MRDQPFRSVAPCFSQLFIFGLLAAVLFSSRVGAQTPAFPGADGAGKFVSGGRGVIGTATTVFEVTNLLDSNTAGTLRYACSQSATYRTIVFRISGTIHLNSPLNIPGNTTVAGQTAPGDGICLADYWVNLNGNNIIVRYLRFRMGDKNQLILDPSVTDTNCWPTSPPFTATCKPYPNVSGSYDSLGATDKNNLMVDHCSVSWSDDEALSLKNCNFTTIQWSLIAEPLDYSYHHETDANGVPEPDYQQHGYGSIYGSYYTTFHHNIYAHCKSRCPRFNDTNSVSTDKMRVDMRNNVIYNWRINTAYGGMGGEFNIVSNYYKAGPDTTTDRRIVGTEATALYFLKGNKMVGQDGENGVLSIQVTTNNWYGTSSGASSAATLSLATPTMTNYALTVEHTAQQAYDLVLAQAGATVPKRDAIDTRVVNEIKTKTGTIIDVQGGYVHGTPYSISSNAWPALFSTTAPTDTDHDGMPDFWEKAMSLNTNSATDRTNRNAEGYTMLEVYLNSLTLPPTAPTNLVANATNGSVNLTWSTPLFATNYVIKRAVVNGGPYSNLATNTATNYTDSLVVNGTTYYYVVSAISAAGESTNSLPVSTTPSATPSLPDAPLNLVATAGNASVALTWSAVFTATNYNVKRSNANGGPYATIASSTNNYYTDATANNGVTYYFVVSAINTVGEGTNSAQASATSVAPPSGPIITTVFNDTFAAGSTLSSLSPAAPTPTTTAYQILSSKSWSPTPTLGSGHLKFGIGITTSGLIEAQALFTNSPVALTNVGDTIALTVTFTNTFGLLTQAGALGFGLYHSGQNQPVPGGLNGTVTGTAFNATNANAKTWIGYVGQLAFTGANSQILTRLSQNNTNNSNQELLTTGSGSSYSLPSATTVGSASAAPSITLTAGSAYTEQFTITLTAANTLAITNRFYAGIDTNGTLLSQFGAVASGGNFVTSKFDAFALGWRVTATNTVTAIDINQITVNTIRTNAAAITVATNSTNLVYQITGGQLELTWPAGHIGWRLQIQTNALGQGLGTNWAFVPGAELTNRILLPINPANGGVFLRMIYP